MRIIHDVARTVDGNTVSQVVLYEFTQDPVDYWQNIHDAIADYCVTPEGRQRVANGQMLTYGDFLDFVPDEFCRKHGFERVVVSAAAVHYKEQQLLIDRRGLTSYLRQRDQDQERITSIHLAITPIARVMMEMQHHTNKIDRWGFSRVAQAAIQWSTEYVDSGESDMRGFVRRKLDALGAPKSTQKGEVQA